MCSIIEGMKTEHALLIGAGILSGVATILVVKLTYANDDLSFLILLYGAGIPYGVVTGIYLTRLSSLKHKFARCILWIIASGASYVLAVQAILRLVPGDGYAPNLNPPAYALGGLVGAFVLTIAFHFIFQKLTVKRHLMIIATGALVAYVVTMIDPNGPNIIYVLYALWQTVITTLLGWNLAARK